MYTLVYYVRQKKGNEVFENIYVGEEYRLRNNALHYLREIVQNDYRENGYGTEERVGSIYCNKSKLNKKGEREIEEVLIKVEKVK